MNGLKEKNICEDSQHKKGYLRQFVSILTGYILLIDVGAHLAWSSPAIPYLTSENSKIPLTDIQGAWIASIVSLATLSGHVTNSLLMDRIGRRYTLLLFAFSDLSSWTLINLAHNYNFLFAARLIAGFSLGGALSFLSPYVGEITEKRIRGMFLVCIVICMNFGAFLINTLGAFLEYRTMNTVMISLPIIAICLFPLMLETPYFHLMRGQDELAIKTLMKLSEIKEAKNVMVDIERMKSGMKSENLENGGFRLLFSDRGSRKALIIMLLVYTTYAFCGSLAIQTYSQTIFKTSGSSLDPKYAAMIIAGVQIFSGLPSTQLIDHWGRRPVYMFSGITSAASLASVASFFFFKDYLKTEVSSVSWLPLVGLILYQFLCNAGISIMHNVLIGELFSVKVKGAAIMISSTVASLFLFASKMMIPALSSYGMYTTFGIFSSVCLIGPIIVVCIVPETKGKNLEEVLQLLSKREKV